MEKKSKVQMVALIGYASSRIQIAIYQNSERHLLQLHQNFCFVLFFSVQIQQQQIIKFHFVFSLFKYKIEKVIESNPHINLFAFFVWLSAVGCWMVSIQFSIFFSLHFHVLIVRCVHWPNETVWLFNLS